MNEWITHTSHLDRCKSRIREHVDTYTSSMYVIFTYFSATSSSDELKVPLSYKLSSNPNQAKITQKLFGSWIPSLGFRNFFYPSPSFFIQESESLRPSTNWLISIILLDVCFRRGVPDLRQFIGWRRRALVTADGRLRDVIWSRRNLDGVGLNHEVIWLGWWAPRAFCVDGFLLRDRQTRRCCKDEIQQDSCWAHEREW